MAIQKTSYPNNNLPFDQDSDMDPTPPAAFRSSSSLGPSGAESPQKKAKREDFEDTDYKIQAVAAPLVLYAGLSPYSGRGRGRGGSKMPAAAAAAASAAPIAPECPYKRAAGQTKKTDWLPDGTIIRKFTLSSGETQDITSLGDGTSFQCFKFGNDQVIKVFIALTDSQAGRNQGTQSSKFDQRMDFLKKSFKDFQGLGIRTACVLNLDTLKPNGYILQEYVPPIKLSWNTNSSDLLDHQIAVLNEFLSILKTAFSNHHYNFWDIAPKNFALVNDHLVLFDIPDQPMQGQWEQFPQAIYGWANRHPAAQAMIATYLKNCLTDSSLSHVHGKIETLIDNLNWQQQT